MTVWAFSGLFVLSLALTGVAWRYALWRALLDEPEARRNHRVRTARGGGLGFVLLLLTLCVRAGWRWHPAWHVLALGLALVGVAGAWDDHRPLPARWRLAVHALAAVLLGLAGVGLGWPGWLCLMAAVAALVLVNIWNFMDGIDGIAASQAVAVSLGAAALLPPPLAPVALAVAAVVLGFLPWNAPRARIFMGDVGSGSLGYAIAVLWALLAAQDWRAGLLFLLPLSAFLTDATLTLLRRMWRRERWWQAHSSHSYQLAVRRQGSHMRVTGLYLLWCVLALLLMWQVRHAPWGSLVAVLAAVYAAAAWAWWQLRRGRTGEQA